MKQEETTRAMTQETPPPVALPDPQNPYYERVSERFGVLQVLLYLCLLLFVVISLLGNTGMITYQNLYYFVKDLNASAESVEKLQGDSLGYAWDEEQSFVSYRQGLAVAGNSSVTVFTASGREIISQHHSYQSPVAVGEGKYLMVYEMGGTQYSLYNSYTRIHTGKTQTPIRKAEMSKSGSYAILTEADGYASVVELYNDDFKKIGSYRYNGYVTDVAIDQKGEHLAVLVHEAEGMTFRTSVRLYTVGQTDPTAERVLSGGLGLYCGYTEAGKLSVLGETGLFYVSAEGDLERVADVDTNRLVYADIGVHGSILIQAGKEHLTRHHITVYDKNGKALYEDSIEGTVEAASRGKDTLFIKTEDTLYRIRINGGRRESIPCDTVCKSLLTIEENTVLLCTAKKATYYRFQGK